MSSAWNIKRSIKVHLVLLVMISHFLLGISGTTSVTSMSVDGSTEDDDGLGDAWMEMSRALESSKDVVVHPLSDRRKNE
ncbi:hypothetical protein RchiOBHm_Chr4g0415551 [Rosa chinensis]|uniref:Uncharacterized protein n=1 Tax=Rosa chinensis TaxID=74649 RepID=A0A2P6QWR4_ROSCH|nr:hypothetical protein RchiOBHm_Chr4g0415551 [Rosa chinensis]